MSLSGSPTPLPWYRRWRTHALLLVVVVAVFSLIWTDTIPLAGAASAQSVDELTSTPVAELAVTKELAISESPEELAARTDGIVLMGGLVVLIVVVGTLATLRRKSA